MGFTLPILVIGIAFALVMGIASFLRNYIRVAPNEAAILYGRKRTVEVTVMEKDPEGGEMKPVRKTRQVGFRIVKGGAALKWPLFEKVAYLPLNVMTLPVEVKGVYSKDGVSVNVAAIANVKIKGDEVSIEAAAERFLGKKVEEIQTTIEETLQGHLRAIIGKMTPQELYGDRDKFSREVQSAAGVELEAMGISIDNLPIKEVTDPHGYLDALGRTKIAEVKKTAEIGEAEAKRDSMKKSSDADKEAQLTIAENAVLISQAQKDRDIQQAQFKALVGAEQAKAEKAHEIAMAAQEEILKVAQAKRDAAQNEALIEVQKQEALRKEQELIATIVKQAEAEKKAAITKAEQEKEVMILNADAAAEKLKREAEGKMEALQNEGKGEASKKQALLEAQAKGDAATVREKLTAEAEGTEKLAAALAKMTTDAKLIIILDKLPLLIDKGGEAMSKVAESMFKSVAAPFANIDSLHIVDIGGNGQALNKLGSVVPQTVLNVLAGFKAIGVDITPILDKFGINTEDMEKVLGPMFKKVEKPTATVDA